MIGFKDLLIICRKLKIYKNELRSGSELRVTAAEARVDAIIMTAER